MKKLFILDERWDSALTDLGIKMAVVSDGCVACAVLKGAPAEERVKKANLKYFYIEDPRKGLSIQPFLSLRKVIERFKPDIVVTIRGDELLFSSLLKKTFNFKLYRIHGEAKGIRNSFLNRYLHRKFVDGVILSSRKLLNEVVIDLPKIFAHGAVDTQEFKFSEKGRERIRKELDVNDSILIGVVGRLDPVKGHELFIKALSILKKKDLKVKGLIVGEEKNVKLSDLKTLAQTLGVNKDIFFITERRKDIVDLMSAIDIGIVPSKGSEMIARTLLEFMACEKPVVATAVGVLPEIVKENFGEIAKVDEESISRGIEAILRKGIKKLGKAAREEAVEKYSLLSLSNIVKFFERKER
ncbi:glycosyl transferase group 1 [Desulfurobacterium thermolithotrophum DSM 11699]|uniref:Glycosyl transferase group 1 n=1 Tax=Desulfurobacterium thermolithotrophum (strain DSM 11699 / BSA) TaxID=868864 RepID=F0S1Y6_DESTD|nr:glycosyltransferase [Desulfurobacterium thermolithotrophum]ADY74067.1 glycosyl transferase group 1 [Desulfurobacterium thermolithotrophum DSM 11699]